MVVLMVGLAELFHFARVAVESAIGMFGRFSRGNNLVFGLQGCYGFR